MWTLLEQGIYVSPADKVFFGRGEVGEALGDGGGGVRGHDVGLDGISGALYGVGFGASSSDVAPGKTDVATDVTYEVVSEVVETDGDSRSYNVVSFSDDLESLNPVAQQIQQGRLQRNSGIVTFYESRADVPGGDPVGGAGVYLDEMQVRSEYSDDGIFPPLSSEEVEQVVNVLGVSGSVYTYVLPGGEGIPVLPDFMTEDRN
jgi:hypothetical protein